MTGESKLAVVVLIVSIIAGAGCRLEDVVFGSQLIVVGGKEIRVDLALTPAQMARGLQHRRHLPPDEGMLFVYSHPVQHDFWMKDTCLPLSIAFINEDGQIIDIQKMEPDNGSRLYHCPLPYRSALEMNQGWFEKNGIQVGDAVIFSELQRVR